VKPVRAQHVIPADVERVFGLLSGASWAQLKDDALHDGSRVVRREAHPDGGVTLAMSRELPAGAPGFLERLLPADGRVLQTDEWEAPQDGVRGGTWRAEVPGAPARLGGTLRLEPTTGGTLYLVEGSVEVRVPLVGGRAETFLAGMVEKLVAKEAGVLRDALAS
jgi:hypothetical protein